MLHVTKATLEGDFIMKGNGDAPVVGRLTGITFRSIRSTLVAVCPVTVDLHLFVVPEKRVAGFRAVSGVA